MAIASSDYERSKASIVLEVIVGLLTAGAGVIAFEAYHLSNKSHKHEEFSGLASELLTGMQDMVHEESGFTIGYKSSSISIRALGKDIEIKFDNEIKTIQNKTIGEVRENLKREILSNTDTYPIKAVRQALEDQTANQRSLAIQFLQTRTHIVKFDYLDTQKLTEACIDLVDNKKTVESIEKELSCNNGVSNNVIDKECHELINEWEKKPSIEQRKIHYVGGVELQPVVNNRPIQSEDEKKIRQLLGEVFFPEKSWEADNGVFQGS